MRCPFCAHDDSQVKDSRPTEDNTAIRRRRQCESCGARFTTFERVQLSSGSAVEAVTAGTRLRTDIADVQKLRELLTHLQEGGESFERQAGSSAACVPGRSSPIGLQGTRPQFH